MTKGTPKKPSSPLNHDRFATLVMNCIRKAGETGDIEYDLEQFRLTLGDNDGPVLFLANAYDEYCSAAESSRPQVLQRYVRSWFAGTIKLPEAFDDLHPDLLPVVRKRSYFDLARMNAGKGVVLPHQVLGEHLAIGLVYDLPQMMRSISQDNLDGWGVTFYEALEAARHNLTQLEHSFLGPQEGEGVYLSAARDSYDSSRLILLDLIRHLRVAGDFVAMVPNPDTLIVTGSDDVDGLKGMLELATHELQQPRPISGVAVRLDGDEWVPWLPDPDHPLFNEFRGLQLQSIGRDYAEQKELLDAYHEKIGEDVFVASYSVMQHKGTGHHISYCVWTKGTISLLPQAEMVVLGGNDQEPVMAPWNKVVEVVGDLMTPLDMYPERYRVEDFPTAEQLAAMGNELELP